MRSCPAAYPVVLPRLIIRISWPISNAGGITLASGKAYTLHADFFNAWNETTLNTLVNRCIDAGINCGKQIGSAHLDRSRSLDRTVGGLRVARVAWAGNARQSRRMQIDVSDRRCECLRQCGPASRSSGPRPRRRCVGAAPAIPCASPCRLAPCPARSPSASPTPRTPARCRSAGSHPEAPCCLLTRFQPSAATGDYSFVWPTQKYLDASGTLKAKVGNGAFVSVAATLSNGNTNSFQHTRERLAEFPAGSVDRRERSRDRGVRGRAR